MDPFTTVPDGWTPADEGHVGLATRRAWQALNHPKAAGRLAAFFEWDGDYAGAALTDVLPSDPHRFTESDLVAVDLLGAGTDLTAARGLVEPGRQSSGLRVLLEPERIPARADLSLATAELLGHMEALYDAVVAVLRRAAQPPKGRQPPGGSERARAVVASMLCARKRPDLFPVHDEVTCSFLGLGDAGEHRLQWQVFRRLVGSPALRLRLAELGAEAERLGGVCLGDAGPLWRLSVLLWMHAPRLGGSVGASA